MDLRPSEIRERLTKIENVDGVERASCLCSSESKIEISIAFTPTFEHDNSYFKIKYSKDSARISTNNLNYVSVNILIPAISYANELFGHKKELPFFKHKELEGK